MTVHMTKMSIKPVCRVSIKALKAITACCVLGFSVLGCVSNPILPPEENAEARPGVVSGLTAHLPQFTQLTQIPQIPQLSHMSMPRIPVISRAVAAVTPSTTIFENPASFTQFEKTIPNPTGPLNLLDPEDPIVRDARIHGVHWPMVANAGSSCVYPRLKGNVSYYHEDKSVATGEDYDPSKLTAAHKSLPFGTIVRCTRLDTGQSVVVMINDRGPYVRGRVLDLSRCAARQIDMINDGVVNCQIDVLAYPLIETMGPRGNG